MTAGGSPTKGRLGWVPRSRAGTWSVVFFALAVAAVVFMGTTAVAHSSVGTFDHEPLLGAPAVLAAVSGITSLALGGYAILRHEQSLLLFLTTAAGLNILGYVLSEALRQG